MYRSAVVASLTQHARGPENPSPTLKVPATISKRTKTLLRKLIDDFVNKERYLNALFCMYDPTVMSGVVSLFDSPNVSPDDLKHALNALPSHLYQLVELKLYSCLYFGEALPLDVQTTISSSKMEFTNLSFLLALYPAWDHIANYYKKEISNHVETIELYLKEDDAVKDDSILTFLKAVSAHYKDFLKSIEKNFKFCE